MKKNEMKKNKFTLLELLVVMGLCVIMLAISAPAFLSLSKGQSVEIAARTIGSELNAARSYAITHKENVALIIPTTESLLSKHPYKSYRACIVYRGSYNFKEWISGEKWEFLPAGTAVIDIDGSYGYNTGNFDNATDVDNVPNTFGPGTVNNVKSVVFLPTGINVRASSNIVVGSSAILESGVSSTSNQITIEIGTYTGKISYPSN